jgi:adenylosuccinate synthase
MITHRTWLLPNKVNIVMDGQFGSTGKGVISGYLAKHNSEQVSLAITNASPNAGHTVDFADGRGKMVCFHLPVSALWNPQIEIYLCAGSIINPRILTEEMEKFNISPSRVTIHPNAAIVSDEDVKAESEASSSVAKIASTQKGVGSALARKVMRRGNVAKNFSALLPAGIRIEEIDIEALCTTYKYRKTILMEVPQGFGLSLNHGLQYPYTTCRDVTVAQALADLGVHPSLLGNVIMALRTFPIRVGNLVDDKGREIGYSGPFYPDSTEITWDSLGVEPERTTVTKRIRRVATFSLDQYAHAFRVNRPDHVFLNFCNYFKTVEEAEGLFTRIWDIKPVSFLGVGPTTDNVIDAFSEGFNARYAAKRIFGARRVFE